LSFRYSIERKFVPFCATIKCIRNIELDNASFKLTAGFSRFQNQLKE